MDSTDTIIGSIEVNGLDGSSIISDVLRLSESELIDLLELESDVPDTHEVKGVMDAAREGVGRNGSKMLYENLFTFVSCLAGESCEDTVMATNELLKTFAYQFDVWMRDAHLKDEYRNGILRYFDGNNWDEGFINYVSTLKDSDAPKSFLRARKLLDTSVEERKIIFFGNKVRSAYHSAKRDINGLANPLWVDPAKLPPGINVSSLLLSIRKRLWPKRAFELARNAVHQQYKRQHKGEDQFQVSLHMEDIKGKIENKYKFDPTFYPSWWLTFVYLGYPAGSSCRGYFVSEKTDDIEAFGDDSDVPRVSRRSLDTLNISHDKSNPASNEEGPALKRKKPNSAKKVIRRGDTKVLSAEDSEFKRRSLLINSLKEQNEMYLSMGVLADDERVRRNTEEIIHLLEENNKVLRSPMDVGSNNMLREVSQV